MVKGFKRLRQRLRRDTAGMAVIELAFVMPPLMFLLMGGFDLGFQLYVRSVLHGEMQKAGREAGLEGSSTSGMQTQIDNGVRDQVFRLLKNPTGRSLNFTRRNYEALGQIGRMETLIDSDGDATCDRSEKYEDSNANGVRDELGSDGQGGARAAVLYTGTLKYKRLFPTHKLMGMGEEVEVIATTVLRNQPYAEANTIQPIEGTCPADDQ